MSEWAESFAILAKYGDEDHAVDSQHDEILAGPECGFLNMDPADAKRLQDLGWYEDGDSGFGHYT